MVRSPLSRRATWIADTAKSSHPYCKAGLPLHSGGRLFFCLKLSADQRRHTRPMHTGTRRRYAYCSIAAVDRNASQPVAREHGETPCALMMKWKARTSKTGEAAVCG